MVTNILFLAGGHLLYIAVFTLIGLIAVWNQKRALDREIVAKITRYTTIEAYQHFVADRARISRAMRRVSFTILCIALPLNFIFSGFFPISSILLPISCISCYMGIYIYDLTTTAIIDSKALSAFQISNIRLDTLFKIKARSMIGALPMLCCLEALALTLLINHYVLPDFMLFLFPFLVLAWLVIKTVFASRFYAWGAPLQPIEHTQWAFLIPRIQAWAKLAGIEFASIQLQQGLIGRSIVGIVGFGRPTLILDETLLRYTDWRQQDAIIAIAIGAARKRIFLTNFVRNFLVLALISLFPAAVSLIGLGNAILFALVLLILLRVASIVTRRNLRSIYFDVDRMAALLTGDPLAVMVALNTISVLNGVSTTRRRSAIPSAQERTRQLETILHQPWPRASHATMPVPSITAIGLGEHYITVPLDQATEPAPPPNMPYATQV